MPFHVINRGVGRQQLFFDDDDYLAFEKVIAETLEKSPLRICAYCVMPNHWHFVMWPEHDGDLGAFMQRLTVTHSARWKQHKKQVGFGHLYQGRYKSFPIEADDHFLKVVRYVERNALRASLVRKAENWKWSSLWIRKFGSAQHRRLLSPWPVPSPRNWVEHVNRPETEAELKALRRSVNRGTPFGSPAWIHNTAKRLGLEFTTRPRGRPKKR
ncbi:MAG: transposase [Planctomycetota bacterium]|nr:transposase [Planctomycetota bacterium]